tara:strand:+ start:265 stop:462 length:198 start_codon:yes stop_codon:yes gene_type:complete
MLAPDGQNAVKAGTHHNLPPSARSLPAAGHWKNLPEPARLTHEYFPPTWDNDFPAQEDLPATELD